jgi:hypothetical protein
MKLSSSIILVSLLATTEAFSVQRAQVSMRVGEGDLSRRQKFNKILTEVKSNPSKNTVESVLLNKDTSDLVEACNWRCRSLMLRKVNDLAQEFGADMDASFGVP